MSAEDRPGRINVDITNLHIGGQEKVNTVMVGIEPKPIYHFEGGDVEAQLTSKRDLDRGRVTGVQVTLPDNVFGLDDLGLIPRTAFVEVGKELRVSDIKPYPTTIRVKPHLAP